MKAFFDRLDAKAAAFFKSKFKKAPKTATPIAPEDLGAPIVIMMGSLSGCTMKDAVAYVRGLAETYITAHEVGRMRVFEDKPRGRFIYELHEGGPGRSIADKVLEQLVEEKKVRIELINGAHVVIEETHGEIFSLVYPAADEELPQHLSGLEAVEDESVLWNIEDLCSTEPLKELYPQNKKLVHIGAVFLGISIAAFILTGGIYTVLKSGMLDSDAVLSQAKAGHVGDAVDNPVWQLDKARMAADAQGKTVRTLKKGATGWSWEIEK